MTTVSEAFPSRYLKAGDLKNKTVKVAIKEITFEEIGQERDKKPVMFFEKVEKGLVLNKTNAIEIGATHGEQMDGWVGKEIELFSQMVPFQGQNVPAIRVRAVAPAAEADPNDPIGI